MAGLAVLVSWQILNDSQDFFHTFSMALYHKLDVKNYFAYVLQFFSLISDSLGSVNQEPGNIKIPKMSLSILAVPGKSKQCKILFGNCRNKKDLFLIVYGLNRTGCQIYNTGAQRPKFCRFDVATGFYVIWAS